MAESMQEDPNANDIMFVVAGGCMHPTRTLNFISLGKIETIVLDALYTKADIILVPLTHGTGASLKSIEALAKGALISQPVLVCVASQWKRVNIAL